mmetsp:Transcript_40954/g.86637  ORF Transcript_40954/g.86637 Transcript_40954/m.86637 type:complete len:814 (+) Transcript_40954:98-2539(+)
MVKKKGALPKGTKMNLAEFNRGAPLASPPLRDDAAGRSKLSEKRRSGFVSWVDNRDSKVWVQCSEQGDHSGDLLVPEGEWMDNDGPDEGQRVTFLIERGKPGGTSVARQVKLQDPSSKQSPKPIVWATGPTYKSSPAPPAPAPAPVARLLPEELDLSMVEPPAQLLHALDFREQTKAEQTHRKIFVGGLPQSWTAAELWQLFGNVSREHVSWMAPGKQGFGWVVFRERSHARQVLGDELERHFHVNVPKRRGRTAPSARVHVKLDVKGALPAPRLDTASRLASQRPASAWRLCWVRAQPALMARLQREVAGHFGARQVVIEGPANIEVLLQDLHPPERSGSTGHKVVVVVSSEEDAERLLSAMREAGSSYPVIVFEASGSVLQKDWVRDPLVTTVARSADGAIDAVVTALDFAMQSSEAAAQPQAAPQTNERDSAPSAPGPASSATQSAEEFSRPASPGRASNPVDGKPKWKTVAKWDPAQYPQFGSTQLWVREGETVEVIAVEGQWVTARKSNGDVGWVPGTVFAETREAAEAAAQTDLDSRPAPTAEVSPARQAPTTSAAHWDSKPWESADQSKNWEPASWSSRDPVKGANKVWEHTSKPWDSGTVSWDSDKAAAKSWSPKASATGWDVTAKAWDPTAAAKNFPRPTGGLMFDPTFYYNPLQGYTAEAPRYEQTHAATSVPLVQPRFTAQNWAPAVEQTLEPRREPSNPGIKTGYAAEKEVFSRSAKDAKRAIAKHNFTPAEGQSGCLDLRMGMPLIVTHTNPESGWAYGYLVSDEAKKGWLPISHVEITSEEPFLSAPLVAEELQPVVAG